MDGDILVVVMPLKYSFGIVTFDKNGDYFIFRQKYAVNISSLYLDCELSSITEFFPFCNTLIGKCLNMQGNTTQVNSVYVVINSSSLSSSSLNQPEEVCNVHSPSEFVFLVSATFPMGVSIFAAGGRVLFQRFSESCMQLEEPRICSSVQRFASVPPQHQVIYCEAVTYLLDIAYTSEIPTFMRNGDGLPFFCSEHNYYTYTNSTISFHNTTKKVQIGSAIPVLYEEDVVWGDCVNSRFVVMQLADGNVISLTAKTKKIDFIGHSQTTPRIFGTTVLLNNFTHALVYDLQTIKLVISTEQRFVMGYVISGPDVCVPSTTSDGGQEPKRDPQKLLKLIAPPVVVILAVIVCFLITAVM